MYWSAGDSTDGLWYQDQGNGIPLILIHGWCMSSAVWARQVEGLAGSLRIITIDLPGHGKSLPLTGGFSVSGCAGLIAGLIAHLDLKNVVLTGWSLGAQIAMVSLPLIKQRVSAIVLVGATPRFAKTDDYPHGLSPAEAESMACKVRRSIRRARDGFSALMFAPDELTDMILASQVHDLLASVPLPETASALEALQALNEIDLRDRLATIDLPTLIINGDQDTISLPGASELMAERIPLARRYVFPASGHAPFLTQPKQFNACLKDFAESVCGCNA